MIDDWKPIRLRPPLEIDVPVEVMRTMSTTCVGLHLDIIHRVWRQDPIAARAAADELLRALGSAAGDVNR